MNVVAYDPLLEADEIKRRGGDPLALDELYGCSDFISLHLPLSVQTRDMVGALAFSQMKDGVRIVSAARGGIIDEKALIAALNSGKVAGAALDVFTEEPPGKTETVLHPRVIGTPHIGAQTAEAQSRAGDDIASEILNVLQDKPLRWKVA
jgi:D-3-phosphoglycerate dehydrogenase